MHDTYIVSATSHLSGRVSSSFLLHAEIRALAHFGCNFLAYWKRDKKIVCWHHTYRPKSLVQYSSFSRPKKWTEHLYRMENLLSTYWEHFSFKFPFAHISRGRRIWHVRLIFSVELDVLAMFLAMFWQTGNIVFVSLGLCAATRNFMSFDLNIFISRNLRWFLFEKKTRFHRPRYRTRRMCRITGESLFGSIDRSSGRAYIHRPEGGRWFG